MNKVFRKNKGLILSLIAMGVVAVILIGVVIMVLIDWSGYRARTEAARTKVQQLRTSTPAPGAENEARIQQDIEFYQQKNIGLVDNFKSPLRPAIEAFLAALPPPKADQLTEEELERYRVEEPESEDAEDEDTDVAAEEGEGDEETPAPLPQIRKLTYDDFRTFFPERFQRFCDDNGIPEERKYSIAVLTQFIARCQRLFPEGSWQAAMAEFERVARPLTWESIDNANRLPIMLGAFGLPRRVADDVSTLQDQVSRMKEAIRTEVGAEFFADGALDFIGGAKVSGSGSSSSSSGDSALNYPAWKPEDYPYVFFHWDVFGDISRRLHIAGASKIFRVIPRLKREGEDNSSPILLAESFEEDGNYKIYHYTVVFGGTMASLRSALANFDTAWKGEDERGRRMYVVRGLALYAGNDGAGALMQTQEDDSERREDRQEESTSSRRPRRRRQEQTEQQSSSRTTSGVEYSDASYAERRARYYEVHRRLREEAEARNNPQPAPRRRPQRRDGADTGVTTGNGSSGTPERQLMTPEELDAYESRLPFNERFGYADVLVGNEECIFYLDIDYVVLEQRQ